MRMRWFGLLGMLVVFSCTSALAQDVNFGPSIKVNDDTTTRNQLCPSLAVDREGNLYLAWLDLRNWDITGRGNIYFSSSFDGGRTWTKNIMIDPDRGAPTQPQLEVDTLGNIYFVWSDEPRGEIYFSMSCDKGTTWTQAVRVNDLPPYAFGARFTVDEDGVVYVIWSDEREGGYWNTDIYFTYSADSGSSWMPNVRVNDHPEADQMMADIAVDREGTIYVVWKDFRSGVKYDLYSAYSVDRGSTWTQNFVKVNNDDIDGYVVNYPSLVVDSNGGLSVVWTYCGRHTGGVYFSRSGNGGWSWTRTVKVNTDSIYQYSDPCLSIDAQGRLYVAWHALAVYPDSFHIYFSMSQDSGRTWLSPNIQVDEMDWGALRPSLGAIKNGELYIAWDEVKDSTGGADIYFSSDTVFSGIEEWRDNPAVIRDFRLYQNYPNPFNSSTTLNYTLPQVIGDRFKVKGGHNTSHLIPVTLKIYNILGQEVRTLVDKKQYPGHYEVRWNGKDEQGKELTSGVYLYQLDVGGYRVTKKLVFLR